LRTEWAGVRGVGSCRLSRGGCRGGLGSRHPEGEAVEVLGDLDLAGEPTTVAELIGHLEELLFLVAARRQLLEPVLGDVDVAGRAAHLATALAHDARHIVADREIHR